MFDNIDNLSDHLDSIIPDDVLLSDSWQHKFLASPDNLLNTEENNYGNLVSNDSEFDDIDNCW